MSDDEGEVFDPAPDEPAEVAQLDTPRAEKVAQAWHLHRVQGHTVKYVGEALGVSPATAWRMAQEGRATAALMVQMARDETKLAQLAQIRAMKSWLYQDAKVDGGKALDYVPVLLKVMAEERAIAGTTAPANLNVNTALTGPDPDVVAAIEATMRQQGELPT